MKGDRPGLSGISYRIGTFASFFEAMKTRLSSADYPALANLRTRDSRDWSIGLLDGWAAIADILTFYQERIANEGYVRTALERTSVLELGRTVGYALRPGVAATAYLAYTLDPTADIIIPVGTRAQSVPAQGQLPQSFETADALHATGSWNTLGVRKTQPQSIDLLKSAPRELYLAGINLKLNPDDILLLVGPNSSSSTSGAAGNSSGPAGNSSGSAGGETPNEPQRAIVRIATSEPFTPPGQSSPSQTHVTLETMWTSNDLPSAAPSNGSASYPETRGLLDGYQAIVDRLLAPPAAHPPNALRLPQKIATAFGENTDAVAKALAVLHPALESTLLPALAQQLTNTQPTVEVHAFRVDTLPFGANAPLQLLGFTDGRDPEGRTSEERNANQRLRNQPDYVEWKLAADETPQTLFLDRYYPSLVATNAHAASYVVFLPGDRAQPVISTIASVSKIGRAQYGISGTLSKLALTSDWHSDPGKEPTIGFLRGTHVYAQSEQLALADVPIADPVPPADSASNIDLDGVYDGLDPGRWLIVSGIRTDVAGAPAAELVMLATSTHSSDSALPGDTLHTILTLSNPLSYQYDRQSVQVYANVVRATHGETRSEVLGSGDGGSTLQAFTLKAAPLTYVPVPTASGAQSTLSVRVNGLTWTETDDFDALGPTDRAFITRTNDAGKTTLVFGDGVHGARLPSGVENVTATYRTGIGQPGNADAGQISTLTNRPLGVRAVINRMPAGGGADPESADQGRSNVPLATAALDRIISVDDYAAVARTFAGVAKAVAARFPGAPPTVHVTVAADGDGPLDATSAMLQNLLGTLRAQGDASVAIDVQGRGLIVLVLSAHVALRAGNQWGTIAPAIRLALLDAFGFRRRALAQDVYQSEIIAAIQTVDGVDFVNVDVFDGIADNDPAVALGSLPKAGARSRIVANPALRGTDGTISPAQLAIFKAELPEAINLQEIGG